jgi:hypothetical protein
MNLRYEEHAPSLANETDIELSAPPAGTPSAGTETFARLRALVATGYQPDFAMSDDRFLLLTHPQKRFKYRDMLLMSSGAVRWLHDDDYTMHFSRWEKKRFDGFLRTVPAPTWWDRTEPYRQRIGAFVIGAVICAVLYVVVVEAIALANYLFWSKA